MSFLTEVKVKKRQKYVELNSSMSFPLCHSELK